MVGNGQHLVIIFADIMRHDNVSVLVENRDGLPAIMADDIVDLRVSFRELCAKVGNRRRQLVQLRQRRRRQYHVGNQVFLPIFLDNGMEFVLRIIQCNRRLVPVSNDLLFLIKGHHVIHGCEIGLDVANHKLHLVANGIVHLPNATRLPVGRIILRSKVMQTNIIGRFAAKCKCNLFVNRNGRLCQCQTDVARSTDKYHLVVCQESKRRQCLSSAGGSNVEDKLGCVFILAEGKHLFLMFVKHHVAVLQ